MVRYPSALLLMARYPFSPYSSFNMGPQNFFSFKPQENEERRREQSNEGPFVLFPPLQSTDSSESLSSGWSLSFLGQPLKEPPFSIPITLPQSQIQKLRHSRTRIKISSETHSDPQSACIHTQNTHTQSICTYKTEKNPPLLGVRSYSFKKNSAFWDTWGGGRWLFKLCVTI